MIGTNMMKKGKLLLLGALWLCAHVNAAEYYVDNVKGSDENPGDALKPFATIAKALKKITGGDSINLVPNDVPYCEKVKFIGDKMTGTPENPTIFDGHGAMINGLKAFPESTWTREGENVYSRYLHNNAWVMDRDGCWAGCFPIVYFDDKPGINCRTMNELKPFGYFLRKEAVKRDANEKNVRPAGHNMLFVMLPPGKTLDDIKVAVPTDSYISVECDNVVVRNITVCHVTGDCFGTTWMKNIVFDNVEGFYAMDQGISNHSARQVLVKNSRFHHNAGCGIVDVIMRPGKPCVVKYQNCLIKDNPYRGGVQFLGVDGHYEMENCVIESADNSCVLMIEHKATVKLKNCLLIGNETKKGVGMRVGDASATMTNCTFFRFKKACALWKAKVNSSKNAFVNCDVVYSYMNDNSIQSDYNYYCPADFELNGKIVSLSAYVKESGQDGHSVKGDQYKGGIPPFKIDAPGIDAGAVLKKP